jgi:hypothetical protein
MSIATLKKKTNVQYNNMSVNSRNGFSLNGGHRSQGYVGQDTRGRFLSRTLMKGNTIRGHGGCCGLYPVYNVVKSSFVTTENPNIIKSSVINNSGMISTQYPWIRRPAPYAVVKPDNNNNLNSHSQYINQVKNITINNTATCDSSGNTYSCSNSIFNKNNNNFNSNKCTIKTDPSKMENLTRSQSQYIENKLHNNCVNNNTIYVAKSTRHTPFSCSNVK